MKPLVTPPSPNDAADLSLSLSEVNPQLYAKFQQEGPAFLEKYNYMLKETPVRSVEDVAKICDIDLTSKEFWLMSLHSYDEVIAEFKRLVK